MAADVGARPVCPLAIPAIGERSWVFRSLIPQRLIDVHGTLVGDTMAEQVNWTVLANLLDETLGGVYNIATRYRQGYVWLDAITVDEIDAKRISISFVGSVEADLQWGCDGDVERGDEHVHTASFPMSGSVWAPVTDIQQLRDLEVEVDTESWFGDRPDVNEEEDERKESDEPPEFYGLEEPDEPREPREPLDFDELDEDGPGVTRGERS